MVTSFDQQRKLGTKQTADTASKTFESESESQLIAPTPSVQYLRINDE